MTTFSRSQLTYFVTGANRGIGLELTRQLISKGQHVIATTRDRAKAGPLIETRATVMELDVADAASIAAVAAKLGARGIDVLINNAGISATSKTLYDCSAEEFQRLFMVNAASPMLVAVSKSLVKA